MNWDAIRRWCILPGVLLVIGVSTLMLAQSGANLPRVPVGAVAAQMTGRLVGGGGINSEYEMVCYLTFVEGLGGAVFAGEASEKNAMFALRTDKFRFQTIANAALLHFGRLVVPGVEPPAIRVYYSPTPNRDFRRPDSFSEGELIATLRTRGIQGALTPAAGFRGEGSVVLEDSAEFTFAGRTISLTTIGKAATVTLAGTAPSAAEFAGAISVPFSGTIRSTKKFRD